MKKSLIVIFFVIAILILAIFSSSKLNSAECTTHNGLPDKKCTPGKVNNTVSQENISGTICSKNYTDVVRPGVDYTEPLKKTLMQKYGNKDSLSGYELDHLIPLELGGDPKSEKNLWPVPYESGLGAYEKNEAGDYLNSQVCQGKISLKEAQRKIADNWVLVYKEISSN